MTDTLEGNRRPQKLPTPPGYFGCGRALERLHRYYDLACHLYRWAGPPEPSRTLAQLFPDVPTEDVKGPDGKVLKSASYEQQKAARKEIHKISVLVWNDINATGINTGATTSVMEFDWDKSEERPKRRDFDLVLDFPDSYPDSRSADGERLLFRTLDGAVGFYESLRASRLREMWNPLNWIAALLRAPVYVLERAHVIEQGTRSHPWIAKPVTLLALYVVVKLAAKALVIRDNYFCRIATITFAGLGRPDGVW